MGGVLRVGDRNKGGDHGGERPHQQRPEATLDGRQRRVGGNDEDRHTTADGARERCLVKLRVHRRARHCTHTRSSASIC